MLQKLCASSASHNKRDEVAPRTSSYPAHEMTAALPLSQNWEEPLFLLCYGYHLPQGFAAFSRIH